jgi:signal transduction histidine kinase/CheY-like chemotaxis protein/HPt (histidine-containing phosphotransfer) domain-containing protein
MNEKFNKSPGKNSIQLKVGFILIISIILLSSACYLLYRNFSSIVSSIRIDINPELRLLSIRDISMDLEKAGNSVRIYTITKNPADIRPYYKIISGIDDKVDNFRSECGNDSVLIVQTDTISNLIEENIVIWNQLISLYNDNQVVEYLQQLSDQLDSATGNNQKKEKGILRRVFNRTPKPEINEEEIASDINKVVEEDRTAREALLTRESHLAANSSDITEKFYDVIAKIELEVSEHIKEKADAANKVATESYRWLILLAISGGLLSLLILFIIIRYARNAYAYQIALENSKDEAERLAKTKELFMANISHEIRTPVTAISGFTEQLLHEPFNENTTRSLNIIKSSSDHLLRIIDDILDFSKLQNNKLVLERVNFSIRKILEEVYSMFEKQAGQNNSLLSYSVSPETPAILLGDPYRLKQIIINLVSNSVKFTKDGSVHFAVSSVKKKTEEVELVMEFTDTGIGIDESKIKQVFEDFTQEEMSTTRKYGGTGLGLSIVKKLVDLQKGTIDFNSRKNKGTRVVCRIPFTKGSNESPVDEINPPVEIPDYFSRIKVLLADDEEYNRLLFKKIFERWNIRCRIVENGMDALEILKEERFDLLFMDVRMPGLDGLKATQFIRDEMKIKASQMPVIFISAAPENEDWQKYRRAGMNAYLQKPFNERTLLATIQSVTGGNINFQGQQEDSFRELSEKHPSRPYLSNLYHIAGGDEKFVKQMSVSFVESTGRFLSELHKAVSSDQWEKAGDLAHKMSPPCKHIGAANLYDYLRNIEKECRKNPVPGEIVADLTEKAASEFEKVAGTINELIAKMS